MKSNQLLELKDLSGWRVATCYLAQLRHGLMGFFPALLVKKKGEEGEVFACLERETLVKILSLLTPRPFRIDSDLILVNETEKVGFSLAVLLDHNKIQRESETLTIITADDFAKRWNDPKFFKWAPGLIGPGTSPSEFRETLILVAAQD